MCSAREPSPDDASQPSAPLTLQATSSTASERLKQLLHVEPVAAYDRNLLTAVAPITSPLLLTDLRMSGSLTEARAHGLLGSIPLDPYTLPLNFSRDQTSDTTAHVMLSFRDTARAQITSDASVQEVLSMNGLDLTLFFRDRQPGDNHTVSTWACEFTKAWPLLNVVTKLAFVHFVGTYMRWYVMPCAKTYAMLSIVMRPLKSQLAVPHSAQIDLCHLPVIRMVQLEGAENWLDTMTPVTQHFNWSHGVRHAVHEVAYIGRSAPMMQLTSQFTSFCDNLQNWTLHESVVRDYIGVQGGIHETMDDPSSKTLS